MSLIVGFFGGPGCGKSTASYMLIGMLKANNYKAELVVESAKEATYAKATHKLQDQSYLVAKHNNDLLNISNHVDIVVTDGSLLNSIAYCSAKNTFEITMAKELYSRFNNIGFILPRKLNYMKYGRSQTKEEAIDLDNSIFNSISYLPENERIDFREYQELQSNDSINFYKMIYDRVVLEANKIGITPKTFIN
jgi:ABC-type dipeptide/oligopeptide/nickel transport system ATPase subunit